jgi:phosphatidylserine decarboxylase
MPEDEGDVVSPADARVLVGSFRETSRLVIKEKFFSFDEILAKQSWNRRFAAGDFAVFRLTPDKYHYNHVPVSGRVADHYEVDGAYHACNPAAVVSLGTPHSKNRRVVTIIDTDVEEGTGVGMVAMVEVVAMMIGRVTQRYSEKFYDNPRPVRTGMFVRKGQPKSLYQPGSSTDILLFEHDAVDFAPDIVRNLRAPAASRFSTGFGEPLIETDVRVRSLIATRRHRTPVRHASRNSHYSLPRHENENV